MPGLSPLALANLTAGWRAISPSADRVAIDLSNERARRLARVALSLRPGLRDLPAVREQVFVELADRAWRSAGPAVDVGAGFSAFGLRLLSARPGRRLIETDVATVLAEKVRRVGRLGMPSGWSGAVYSLRTPEAGWPAGEPVAMIAAQGVLVYLTPGQLATTLGAWRDRLAPDGLLLFDVLVRQPPSRLGAAVARVRGRRSHGPFAGTFTSQEAVVALLVAAGFEPVLIRPLDELASEMGWPAPGVRDELVCLARRS